MKQQQLKQSANSPAISPAIREVILQSARVCVFKAAILDLSSRLSTEELDALTLSMEKKLQIIANNA